MDVLLLAISSKVYGRQEEEQRESQQCYLRSRNEGPLLPINKKRYLHLAPDDVAGCPACREKSAGRPRTGRAGTGGLRDGPAVDLAEPVPAPREPFAASPASDPWHDSHGSCILVRVKSGLTENRLQYILNMKTPATTTASAAE